MATKAEVSIALKPLKISRLEIRLIGDTELITHAWSEKAKKQILAKQQKKNTGGKEIRDPQAEYESGFYHFPGGGYGFPAIGIKQCVVGIAHKDYGIEKTLVRKSLFVDGEPDESGNRLVKIVGEPKMREDMVTIGMGTADLRYRPQFLPWFMDVTIQYNEDFMSAEQIVNLFNLAGFGVGLGEWRPEKGGQSGMFHVATSEELK